MVRVILGTGLPITGQRQIQALTLGHLKTRLREAEPSLAERKLRWFVNGQDAELLEGESTPVDTEDTVLVIPG